MGVWRDCVVSVIDLVGIKEQARRGEKGEASRRMRELHQIVHAQMERGLPHHDHAYVWNDSVLLLAFPNQRDDQQAILQEVDGLKWRLRYLGKSYAISVKGRTFPVSSSAQGAEERRRARTTVVKASSYAMANCFLIEEELSKKLKQAWYVDSRLARRIRTEAHCSRRRSVGFLPGNRKRRVYVYDGYLWNQPCLTS